MNTMSVEEILAKLIAYPVLGGESNLDMADWIISYLRSHEIPCHEVWSVDRSKKSIHCRIGPAVDGGVILSGHMDVVPVEGQNWTSDPFVLTDKGDGRLYGRGTCDMNGFLACCLASVPMMKRAPLNKPIYFAFSYDEEIGCLSAPELAQNILDTYDETPKYAIIGEPSMLQPIIGQKGIVVYKTKVNGSQGHSSRIRSEVSAIHVAARLICWLEDQMDHLISEGHVDERFYPPHTTIHCGKIYEAGIAPNVIADSCVFDWDIRVIPRDTASHILAEFESYCSTVEDEMRTRFPLFKIETVYDHSDVPPLDTQESEEVVDLIKKISGRFDWSTVSYAAEAGQFKNAGFQSVICGPGSIAQAHRADEYVDIVQLQKCLSIMERLTQELSR